MARIEKTVFVSYRRKDWSSALLVYKFLTANGYDVFFDFKTIHSGDFEKIIISNIKARAHFLVILTPTALDRCNEPGDWLRREIETAISEKRNIIPLLFDNFKFEDLSVLDKLSNELANFKKYNGLKVPTEFFDEAMMRLSEEFLSVTLDTVLHPVSSEVQKEVKVQQNAANKAILQVERVKQWLQSLFPNISIKVIVKITIFCSILALAIIGSMVSYPIIRGLIIAPVMTSNQSPPRITTTTTPPLANTLTQIPSLTPKPAKIIITQSDFRTSYTCPVSGEPVILSHGKDVELEFSGMMDDELSKLVWWALLSGSKQKFGLGKSASYPPKNEGGIIYVTLDEITVCTLQYQVSTSSPTP